VLLFNTKEFLIKLEGEFQMSKITMYSKKTCPFCDRAEQLLQRKGVQKLNKIEVDANANELQIMIARTGRRTVPQIFIGDTFVGGFDDLAELDHAGKLDSLLNYNGAT